MSDIICWAIASGIGAVVALKLGPLLINLRNKKKPKRDKKPEEREMEEELEEIPEDYEYDDSE